MPVSWSGCMPKLRATRTSPRSSSGCCDLAGSQMTGNPPSGFRCQRVSVMCCAPGWRCCPPKQLTCWLRPRYWGRSLISPRCVRLAVFRGTHWRTCSMGPFRHGCCLFKAGPTDMGLSTHLCARPCTTSCLSAGAPHCICVPDRPLSRVQAGGAVTLTSWLSTSFVLDRIETLTVPCDMRNRRVKRRLRDWVMTKRLRTSGVPWMPNAASMIRCAGLSFCSSLAMRMSGPGIGPAL
jgi:hypothetical protein